MRSAHQYSNQLDLDDNRTFKFLYIKWNYASLIEYGRFIYNIPMSFNGLADLKLLKSLP